MRPAYTGYRVSRLIDGPYLWYRVEHWYSIGNGKIVIRGGRNWPYRWMARLDGRITSIRKRT